MQYIFTPGQTRLSIPVTIVDDSEFEEVEQFLGRLSTSAEHAIIDIPTTILIINDNDCKLIILLSQYVVKISVPFNNGRYNTYISCSNLWKYLIYYSELFKCTGIHVEIQRSFVDVFVGFTRDIIIVVVNDITDAFNLRENI